jgi:hypothetical protein
MGALMFLQKVRNYLPVDTGLKVQRQISQLPSLAMISTSHSAVELFGIHYSATGRQRRHIFSEYALRKFGKSL